MSDCVLIYCLGIDSRRHGNRDYDTWPPIEYAHFSAIGTWTDGKTCEVCGEHNCLLIPPLLVEWEGSSTTIADFSYNGIYEYTFIVQTHVARFMKEHRFECQYCPIEYVRSGSKAKKHVVPYPYVGPQQYWIECETFLELDQTASGVRLEKPKCPVCQQERYTGKYKDIVIRKPAWHGEKMFRIRTNGKSGATFVTQEGLDLLLSQNYTNLLYLEAGEIVD